MIRKYALDAKDVDGTRMAADIAGKVLEECNEMSREDLIAFYIETLRMAYSEICEAFQEDARKSRGPCLNPP